MNEKRNFQNAVCELTHAELSKISGGCPGVAVALAARMIWTAMEDPDSVIEGFLDALN
jgi:bacteriocin-like protein